MANENFFGARCALPRSPFTFSAQAARKGTPQNGTVASSDAPGSGGGYGFEGFFSKPESSKSFSNVCRAQVCGSDTLRFHRSHRSHNEASRADMKGSMRQRTPMAHQRGYTFPDSRILQPLRVSPNSRLICQPTLQWSVMIRGTLTSRGPVSIVTPERTRTPGRISSTTK